MWWWEKRKKSMEISDEKIEKLECDQMSLHAHIKEDIRKSILRANLKEIPFETVAISIVQGLEKPEEAEILAELIDKNKNEVWG